MNESKKPLMSVCPNERMLEVAACGILFPVWIAEASSVWTLLSCLHF